MTAFTKDIIFFHVPKAAGTSFYNRLAASVGGRPVLFRHIVEGAFKKELADARPKVWSAHPSGDFGRWQRLLKERPEASKVTFLREPVDRYVSEYCFREGEYRSMKIDLADTLALDPLRHLMVDNLQTKILASMGGPRDYSKPATQADLNTAKGNLIRHFLFGLVEHYEESCHRIAERLELNLTEDARVMNVNAKRQRLDALPVELVERIELHNLYDLDLYDFALTLFLGRRGR